MKLKKKIKELFSEEKRPCLIKNICGITALYMLYTLVASLSTVNIFEKLNSRYFSDVNDLGADFRFILALVWSLVILSSFVNTLLFNDTEYLESFLSLRQYHGVFYKRFLFVLGTEKFWVSFVILAFWSLVMPIREAFASFLSVAYGDTVFGFSYLWVLITIPIIFVTVLLTYSSALGWIELKCSKGGLPEKKSVGRLIWKFAYTSLGFIVAALMLPLVCVIIYATALILGVFVFALPMAAIIALLIYLFLKYGRGIRARRRFMKGLKRVCRENKYRLTNVRKIYSSLFFGYEGANFTVEADGTAYTCKLVGIPHRKTPVYLDEEGELSYTRRVLFVAEKISSLSYFFEADKKLNKKFAKIIILTPNDQRAYATNGSEKRRLEYGDKVMGYGVYHASSFVNALERKCII